MPNSEAKSDRPKPDPKALTPEYHKARKQLMLWAGILFVWELVGIDLSKAEAAGGNVGAIIAALRSPEAIPWVLLILVAYFAFKVSVEWFQCSAGRRSTRAAKVDFLSAWIVALAAYALYFGQTISRTQLADFVQRFPAQALSFLAGFIVGVFIGKAFSILVLHEHDSKYSWKAVAGHSFVAIPIFSPIFEFTGLSAKWTLILVGFVIAAALRITFSRLRHSFGLLQKEGGQSAENSPN